MFEPVPRPTSPSIARARSPALGGRHAVDPQRVLDVLERGEHRHEVERLEDEAEPAPAQQRPLALGEAGEIAALDRRRARRRGNRARRADGGASTCRCPRARRRRRTRRRRSRGRRRRAPRPRSRRARSAWPPHGRRRARKPWVDPTSPARGRRWRGAPGFSRSPRGEFSASGSVSRGDRRESGRSRCRSPGGPAVERQFESGAAFGMDDQRVAVAQTLTGAHNAVEEARVSGARTGASWRARPDSSSKNPAGKDSRTLNHRCRTAECWRCSSARPRAGPSSTPSSPVPDQLAPLPVDDEDHVLVPGGHEHGVASLQRHRAPPARVPVPPRRVAVQQIDDLAPAFAASSGLLERERRCGEEVVAGEALGNLPVRCEEGQLVVGDVVVRIDGGNPASGELERQKPPVRSQG